MAGFRGCSPTNMTFSTSTALRRSPRAPTPSAEKAVAENMRTARARIETAVLQYPPDTYAGAGVLVPVADQLRRGGTELDIHVFDCALGPRILILHADLTRETMALPSPRRRVGQGRGASGVRLVQRFSEALRTDDPDVVRPFARLRFRRRHAVALLSRSRGLAGEYQNRAQIAAGIRAARAAVAHGAH